VIAVCGRNSAKPLRAGAASANVGGAVVTHIGRDWHAAYRLLAEKLRSGDVVLLKGRRTQRLERLFLALQGVEVGCRVPACKCSVRTCRACPMLKTGWEGRQVTV
jgi:UDP-N-acetylmuramoyl-tripeptide--D-alanyl-D-alanine ligase